MNGEKKALYSALGEAFVLVSVAALTLVLMASLLARTGMPFTAAYTASVLACTVGTLAVSYGGRTLIALPSPAIMAWLVYEEIIARGLSWQEVLGIAAVVSLLGAMLLRTNYAAALTGALPPIVRTGLVLGLGLTMLVTAALYARILLPSPWALTMGGTLSDPLTYFTLTGVLLVLLLHERSIRAALPLGMGVIGLLSWAEGFWEIPTAPFLVPDLLPIAFALTLPRTELFPTLVLGLTLLLALSIESTAVLTVQTDAQSHMRPLARLFTVSGGMTLLGAFPLTIAPISAALPEGQETRRIGRIPLTALLSGVLFLILLPCAPLLQALADFPAVPAIALTVLGLRLLMRGFALLRSARDISLREGAVLAAFLLTVYDIKTGLTTALVLWTLLTAVRGEHIPRTTWGLTVLLTLFFLLKWIQI